MLYLYVQVQSCIHLLAVFAKNEMEDLTPRGYRDLVATALRLKKED